MPDGEDSYSTRWFSSTRTIVISSAGLLLIGVGILANIAGALPWISEGVRLARDRYPLVGWALAVAAALLIVGLIGEARERGARLRAAQQMERDRLASSHTDAIRALNESHQRALEETQTSAVDRQRTRDRQNRSDIYLSGELLGGLSDGSALRQELADHELDQYFRSQWARQLEEIDRGWALDERPIYDAALADSLDQARTAFMDYWHTLRHELDAPMEIDGHFHDLRVLRPPGGEWGNDWDKYYAFVRRLAPLRLSLLSQLRSVDARLYELSVESGPER